MATEGSRSVRQQKRAINKSSSDEDQPADVTEGPRSVRQQKKAINKSSSDEDQTVDATCRCYASKKTFCHYDKKSPKRFKLLKGEMFRICFC